MAIFNSYVCLPEGNQHIVFSNMETINLPIGGKNLKGPQA